jgi:hypothetical protein
MILIIFFIEFFEMKADEKYAQKKDILATKDDIAIVRKEISESKSGTIKWMFIFWIGQLTATAGIIFAFLTIYFKK